MNGTEISHPLATASAAVSEGMPFSKPLSAIRPKILFFYLDFGALGGIERYIHQAAMALRERGQYEPVVVCSADTPFFHRLREDGIRVHGIQTASIFSKSFLRTLDLGTLGQLKSILNEEKPVLVHTHIGLVENLFFKRLGYPVVMTFHGYGSLYSIEGVECKAKQLFKRITQRIFAHTASHLEALLFVSHAEQKRMQAEGYLPEGLKNVAVLPNGVPVEAIQKAALAAKASDLREKMGIPDEAQCIAFINRLDVNKNPLAFIELAKRLSSEPGSENLHFLIVGDGPLSDQVQAASDTMANLHYFKQIPDIYALLGVCDLTVSLAQREGFGLGVLESIAAGTPCLAYAAGGITEVLDSPEGRICLVPVNDLDAMAERITAFLKTSNREYLSMQLQQRAQTFDQSRWIEGLEAAYQRMTPLVSVILPVYNGQTSVLRATHSVLNQQYRNLELIIVDDGSTDGTAMQLALLNDSRVRIIQQGNQGVAAARNNGFKHAAGEYIAFIDADDVWLPEKISSEMRVIGSNRPSPDENPACLVYSSYYAVDEHNILIHRPPIRQTSGDCSLAVLEDEGLFLPSTTLLHRSIYEEIGGFDGTCYHEDRAFFIRACQHFPAYPTGKRLVLYRQSESGRCRSILASYEQALEAELSIVEALRHYLSPEQQQNLHALQLRNLFYRFLMYGYIEHASRLYPEVKANGYIQGLKGRLALLSMQTHQNLLGIARMLVQGVNRIAFSRWMLPKEAVPSC